MAGNKKDRFTIKISDRHLTISYRGHTHLRLVRNRILGFQAWKTGRFYCIEYYLAGTAQEVVTEYTRRNEWENILRELTKVLPEG
jgi:hypothetical protein